MRVFFQIVILAISFLMLAGCAELSSTMNDISSKHQESGSQNVGTVQTPSCENWCHNGWCSTHCANTANGDQY